MTEEDEGISVLARQGGITFLGNVINGVVGFSIVVLITQYVSPSIYGLFVLATSIVLFLQVFANLGLPTAIDYFVPQYLDAGDRGKAKGVIVQVTGAVLITSSLVGIALAASAARIADFFGEPSLRIALLLLSVAIPMLGIYNVLLTSIYSIKKLQYRVVMRDVVRPLVRLAATIVLLLIGLGLFGVVGGYVVGLFAAIAVGAFVFVYKGWSIFTAEIELVAAKPVVTYAVPLAMTSVVYVLMGHVDYFVLGYYLSSDEVGVYRVGYSLGTASMIVFYSLSPVFKPLIAEKRDDTDLVEQRFRVAARWIAGFSMPMAITIGLGASSYLSVFYTPQYARASTVVAILAGAYLANATFGGPDGTLLQGLGYSRIVFANTAVLFGSNALVSLALVPLFGIEGAAIGSATALTLVTALTLGELYHVDGVHPFTADFAKIVLAGIPATVAGGALVYADPADPIVVVALPVVVLVIYCLSLVVTDAFTDEDARMLAQFGPGLERFVPARLQNW